MPTPGARLETLDAALELVESLVATVWASNPPTSPGTVSRRRHPELGARDLLHLACCRRHGVEGMKT